MLNDKALTAAVRECARITAPNITDEIFARERDANSERYRNTCDEVALVLTAYLSALPAGEAGDIAELVRERIGQDFDGECHLAEHEANRIIAALTSQSARIEAVEAIARLIVEDVSSIPHPTRLSPRTVERIVFDARKLVHGHGHDASPLPDTAPSRRATTENNHGK